MTDPADSAALTAAAAAVEADLTADDTTIATLQTQVATLTAELATANTKIAQLEAELDPLAVTTVTLPAATVGVAYTATLHAAGGTEPYTWTATGLPSGLTLSSSGVLSGTPKSALSLAVTFVVTDTSTPAQRASGLVTITISPAPVPPPSAVPFSASFGRPIPTSQPADPNSAAITKVVENYVAKPEGTDPSGGYFWGVNLGANGIQVMEAVTTLVPLVCVGRPGYPTTLPAGFPTKLGIPTAAAVGRTLTGYPTAFSKDLPFILIDPVKNTATEIWELTADDAAGSSYHCTNAGQYAYTPSATGVGKGGSLPFGSTALSAAGISYAATLLMQADVVAGVAKHMLACALPVGAQPPRMPATASDYANAPAGVNPAAYPGQGTIYRLPPSLVVPSTWPLTERVIATALRDYGMICIDQAGAPQIQAQGPIGGLTSTDDPISAGMAGAQEYNVLSNIPWSELEVVLGPTDWTATAANW
jgi:hypothetical protein